MQFPPPSLRLSRWFSSSLFLSIRLSVSSLSSVTRSPCQLWTVFPLSQPTLVRPLPISWRSSGAVLSKLCVPAGKHPLLTTDRVTEDVFQTSRSKQTLWKLWTSIPAGEDIQMQPSASLTKTHFPVSFQWKQCWGEEKKLINTDEELTLQLHIFR